MAKAVEVMNEKKASWSAFQALMPNTPSANGIRVMALSRTNTRMGMKIFFSFDLRAAWEQIRVN